MLLFRFVRPNIRLQQTALRAAADRRVTIATILPQQLYLLTLFKKSLTAYAGGI